MVPIMHKDVYIGTSFANANDGAKGALQRMSLTSYPQKYKNSGGPRTVPSVLKAVSVLDALASAQEPLTLGTLSRLIAVPKSTVSAICIALEQSNLIYRLPHASFTLGHHLLYLSNAYLEATDITVEFDRMCRQLNPLPQETLVLGVRDGSDVLYIAQRKGTGVLGVSYEIGKRLPMSCTASGKALLASLATSDVASLYASSALPRLTPNSIADLDCLFAELNSTRERQYAIDNEETSLGMMCFGVAVGHRSSNSRDAALAVSLVKSTVTDERAALIVEELMNAARAFADRLTLRTTTTTTAKRASS